jgi:GxxExxY protein
VTELLLKDQTGAILGAAIEVHRQLGSGFLEAVYQEALEIEFETREIPFVAQKPLAIAYKGKHLQKSYCADFVCYDQIVVELKAISLLSGADEAQAINYLKATGLRVALVLNFGAPMRMQWKRLVY